MCSLLGAAPVRLFFGKIELLCADGFWAGDRNPKTRHRIGLERLVIQPCRIAVHGQIRINGGDAVRLFATERSIQVVSFQQLMHPSSWIPLDVLGE